MTIAAFIMVLIGMIGLLLSWLTIMKKLTNGEKRRIEYIVMAVSIVLVLSGKYMLK